MSIWRHNGSAAVNARTVSAAQRRLGLLSAAALWVWRRIDQFRAQHLLNLCDLCPSFPNEQSAIDLPNHVAAIKRPTVRVLRNLRQNSPSRWCRTVDFLVDHWRHDLHRLALRFLAGNWRFYSKIPAGCAPGVFGAKIWISAMWHGTICRSGGLTRAEL